MTPDTDDRPRDPLAESPREWLRARAPFLFEESLQTHIVGSRARQELCARHSIASGPAKDIDLAWSLDTETGKALLESEGVSRTVTDHAVGRGTLAFGIENHRFEITSFRGPEGSVGTIDTDLAHRDATVNAIAWRLHDDRLLDPMRGLEDWRSQILRSVGPASERVEEHPIRFLRYHRQAATQGLEMDREIRRLRFRTEWLERVPREAWAAEFRRGLMETRSPGRFCVELAEVGTFEQLAPSLHKQFDGRPAGPVRYHPEISQALHLSMALDWAVEHTELEDPEDRIRLLVAVLCHDLGKSLTDPADFPSHRGHEVDGLPLVDELLDQLPGLSDQSGRRLAKLVCELHLQIRRLGEVKPGTLAKIYDRHLRPKDFPLEIFVDAVAADSGGRLGYAADGIETRERLRRELEAIRATCETVDIAALRQRYDELSDFRAALHEARARVLRGVFSDQRS